MTAPTALEAARKLLDAGEPASCAVAELMVLRDLDRHEAETIVHVALRSLSPRARRAAGAGSWWRNRTGQVHARRQAPTVPA